MKNLQLFCFVSSLFYNLLKNILPVWRIKIAAFENVQQMHFHKLVWFIWFWPAVYLVLTELIVETKEMGLIFHKNREKTKNGVNEETGLNCQKVTLRNVVFFSKREIDCPNKLML